MNTRARSALTFCLIAACAGWVAPAHAGLVAYWSFDGCTTTDASGHGANLTPFGSPTCVPGRFGNAWQMNGIDQYLERSTDDLFTPGARAWSVAVWEKTSTPAAPPLEVLLEWYRCGANPLCNVSDGATYILGVVGTHPYWEVRDDGLSNTEITDSTSAVTDGNWHFLVGTMNPATDSTKLYVDGVLKKVVAAPLGVLSRGSVSIPLEVGRHFRTGWSTPDYYFPGTIDEARIFDEELTPARIAQLFTANTVAVAPEEASRSLAIVRSFPNPARGGHLSVAFTLAAAGAAEITLFDVGGRRLTRIADIRGIGEHELDLSGARSLAPGVYLVRLVQAGRSVAQRVTVLE